MPNELEELRKKKGWTLRRERKKLTLRLKELKEGTDEYKATISAISDIEKVLNERINTATNVGKVVGMVGITVAGLFLTYNVGDKGENLPNRNTSKFTDGLMGFFRK